MRKAFLAFVTTCLLSLSALGQGSGGTGSTANQFRPTATPPSPPCPYSRMFMNMAGQMALVDCAGVVTTLGGGSGGTGTVTTVSIGNLSPLFTAGITNPTTTPAIAFALSNAAANTYFGNATGSTGAPSYTAAGALTKVDDTNVTLTLGGNPTTSLLRSASLTLGWTGQLAVSRGGTGLSTATNNGVLVGNGTAWTASVIPTCSNGITDKLLYNNSTQTFTCGVDQTSGGGSGITTLNALTAGTQSFAKVDDTNVTLAINSVTATHTFTLGWTGTLAKGRQNSDTVYSTGGTANRVAFFTASRDVVSDSSLAWDNTNKRLGIGTTSPGLPLDVVADGSALAQQWRETGAGTARIQMQIPSSFGQLGTSSNHAFSLMTNGIQRVNVEATGGTVFGAIVPATATVMVNALNALDTSLIANNASGSSTPIATFQVNASNRFRFLSTGEAIFGLPGTITGKLTFGNSSNSNTIGLQAGATASNLTFTLPTADGANGECLKTNGSQTLSFGACSGGGGGSGDVVGPAGATDNAIARFDSTTGKLIQSSPVTIADTSGNMAGVGTLNGHTIPGGTDTFAMLGTAQTFTANQTFGSGIARMTWPRVTTGILDANGNQMLAFSPVSSAVNYFQIGNTATAGSSASVLTLEAAGSDTNISMYLKAKGSDVTDGGQIRVDDSKRYDRPMFARNGNPLHGWGFKSGGAWFSINAANIKLGAGDNATGEVNLSGGANLIFHGNGSASEDCPPCGVVGFNKASSGVVGFIAAAATPDGTYPNGATWRAIPNAPAQITAAQNNYNAGAASYFQKFTTDASRQITGLTFNVTQVSGQVHQLWNSGANDIVLVHESASSTAANRFKTFDTANLTITPGSCANLIYDAGSVNRWLVTPCVSGGGGGSGTVTSVDLTVPSWLSVSGNPVTSSGTLAITEAASQTASRILATDTTSSAVALRQINTTYVTGGALSGNGAKFATTTGTLTSGRCVQIDANGNFVEYSGGCGTGAGGADTALSNLSSVAINTSLLPVSDNSISLGSSAKRWADLFLVGNIKDGSGNRFVQFTAQGSAVNYLDIQNAATTFNPTLSALGSDSNVGFNLQTKGSGTFNFTVSPASTNTTDEFAQFVRNSTGTAANSIGASYGYYIQTSTTPSTLAGGEAIRWENATHASRTSRIWWNTVNSGTLGERMGVDHNGIRLPEISSAATPAANFVYLYAKDNGSGVSKLYYKGDDGTEIGPLAAGGGGGGGSPGGSSGDIQTNDGASGFAASNLNFASNAVTQTLTSLGTTLTESFKQTNSTAAAAGAQQVSPAFVQEGQGWKTASTAASQSVKAAHYVLPVQGTSAPTGLWKFAFSINGGAYGSDVLQLSSTGQVLTPLGSVAAPGLVIGQSVTSTGFTGSGTRIHATIAGTAGALFLTTGVSVGSGQFFAFNSSTDPTSGSDDVLLGRAAAATLRLGNVNAASPVAQKLIAQGSRGGTDSNVAGANLTIVSGLGTGNATPSQLRLSSPLIGSSGTTAQTETIGLTIINGTARLSVYTVATLPGATTSGEGAMAFVTDATSTTTYTTVSGGGSNKVLVISDGTNWIIH